MTVISFANKAFGRVPLAGPAMTQTTPAPCSELSATMARTNIEQSIRRDEHFWWATLLRGSIAILAGSAIMVVPTMTQTLLLMPIAIVFAILALAVYVVLDSAIVFVTSYMAATTPTRLALRLQGTVGVTIGALLYFVYFERVQLHWFLALITVQSLAAAVSEFLVARHARSHSLSVWNFTAAGVALVFGAAYAYIDVAMAGQLMMEEISWLIYGYLLAFGLAQCLTAARMLYSDYTTASQQG